jgi:serine/threonine protein kinase
VRTVQEARVNDGTVELMRSIDKGHFVACKKMPNTWVHGSHEEFKRAHPQSAEEPWSDVCISHYLFEEGFPYVCAQFGVFQDISHTYVLSSFATGGDLFTTMEKLPAIGFQREESVRPLMQQICMAVKALHDKGIAHRDLSPENILLTDDGHGGTQVKLIDFGMASLGRFCTHVRGKPSFRAPEMFLSTWYDGFRVDAFQLGVVLFGLVTQDYPWSSTCPGACKLFSFIESNGMRAFLQIREVIGDSSKVLFDVLSASLVDTLECFLMRLPEDRLTLGEACYEQTCANTRSVFDDAWLSQRNSQSEHGTDF